MFILLKNIQNNCEKFKNILAKEYDIMDIEPYYSNGEIFIQVSIKDITESQRVTIQERTYDDSLKFIYHETKEDNKVTIKTGNPFKPIKYLIYTPVIFKMV